MVVTSLEQLTWQWERHSTRSAWLDARGDTWERERRTDPQVSRTNSAHPSQPQHYLCFDGDEVGLQQELTCSLNSSADNQEFSRKGGRDVDASATRALGLSRLRKKLLREGHGFRASAVPQEQSKYLGFSH
jgi:hypothetical protein